MRIWQALFTVLLLGACSDDRSSKPPPPAFAVNEVPKPQEPTAQGKPPAMPQDVAAQTTNAQARNELIEQLWRTPLGKMFRAFLFGEDNHVPLTMQSHHVVERLYRDVRLTFTRMSALQLMVEDLYDRAAVTPKVHERLSLLETAIALKRQVLEASASKNLFRQAPVFLAIGLLGGSPLARNEAVALTRDAWWWLFARLRRRASSEGRALASAWRYRQLVSSQMLAGYNPYQAFSVFLHSFGGYSVIYYALQTGSADSVGFQNKVWFYGFQSFVDLEKI